MLAANTVASVGSSRASAASMAAATCGTQGMSYQKCGFTSGPCAPRTAWTNSTTRLRELLRELRAAGLGALVLLGFLCRISFTSRFARLSDVQRGMASCSRTR